MSADPAATQARVTLSAFFSGAAEVDEAVYRLGMRGVPRDLLQVAATEDTARRHYPRGGVPHGRQAARMAGAGALVGLLSGIGISLVLVVWPGEASRAMSLVQLLGPNFSTMLGAVVGAVYGLLAPRPTLGVYGRLRERADALLLVVCQFPAQDADEVRALLVECGGSDVAVAGP